MKKPIHQLNIITQIPKSVDPLIKQNNKKFWFDSIKSKEYFLFSSRSKPIMNSDSLHIKYVKK